MITSVLLRGYLSKKEFEEAFQEIKWLVDDGESECVLVIDSDGGDLVPAMEFVRKVKKLDIRFVLKIYNAQSVAAFLFLSLLREDSEYAEMKKGSRIGFHRGYLKLEVSDLSDEGKVPQAMLCALRAYTNKLDMILKQWGIEDPKLLAELHGSGWLNLSTERCLQYGIVRELF